MKFTNSQENQTIKRIALRQIAWCYSLTFGLRGQKDVSYLDAFISKENKESIRHHKNLSLAILNQHNEDLKAIFDNDHIGEFQYVQITIDPVGRIGISAKGRIG